MNPSFVYRPLNPDHVDMMQQAAEILVDAFSEGWPDAWPDLAAGMEEVADVLAEENLTIGAFDAESGRLVGWAGALPTYGDTAWELHPLAVHPDYQRQGIGRELVFRIEEMLRAEEALTIYLGTDDETLMTSVGGMDLFPEPLVHLSEIQDRAGHPFVFYQKLGYAVVGIIPDANGPGKPDILMAKSLFR